MKGSLKIAVALLSVAFFSVAVMANIESDYAETPTTLISKIAPKENIYGKKLVIFYPSSMSDYSHGVIVWGNGSTGSYENYDGDETYKRDGKPREATGNGILQHLARWGFVVIASDDGWCGDGETIYLMAEYMFQRGNTPGDIFYNKLTDFAAVGHSQGAAGVINASFNSPNYPNSVISNVVCISLPNDSINNFYQGVPDMSKVVVPCFFIRGNTASENDVSTWDELINEHYNETAPGAQAVAASCLNFEHTDPCDAISSKRAKGVSGDSGARIRGYLTAWLRWHLMSDINAYNAFNGGTSAEIQYNDNWKCGANDDGPDDEVRTKNLP